TDVLKVAPGDLTVGGQSRAAVPTGAPENEKAHGIALHWPIMIHQRTRRERSLTSMLARLVDAHGTGGAGSTCRRYRQKTRAIYEYKACSPDARSHRPPLCS